MCIEGEGHVHSWLGDVNTPHPTGSRHEQRRVEGGKEGRGGAQQQRLGHSLSG